MNIFGLFVLLLVASVCGSIGSAIAGYSSRGCLTSIILGLVGAIIGTWFSKQTGISDFLYVYRIPVVWSVIGSALFVAVVNMFSKRRK